MPGGPCKRMDLEDLVQNAIDAIMLDAMDSFNNMYTFASGLLVLYLKAKI